MTGYAPEVIAKAEEIFFSTAPLRSAGGLLITRENCPFRVWHPESQRHFTNLARLTLESDKA